MGNVNSYVSVAAQRCENILDEAGIRWAHRDSQMPMCQERLKIIFRLEWMSVAHKTHHPVFENGEFFYCPAMLQPHANCQVDAIAVHGIKGLGRRKVADLKSDVWRHRFQGCDNSRQKKKADHVRHPQPKQER